MSGNQRRSHRNRGHRREGKKQQKNQFNKSNLPECPICNKTVRDILTAISIGDDNTPAHFDCVLKKITETEDISPNEKVCYLGGGSFGIVKFRKTSNSNRFFVRKRIQFEPKESKSDWRKRVSDQVSIR